MSVSVRVCVCVCARACVVVEGLLIYSLHYNPPGGVVYYQQPSQPQNLKGRVV
jgi:hypothetical protein